MFDILKKLRNNDKHQSKRKNDRKSFIENNSQNVKHHRITLKHRHKRRSYRVPASYSADDDQRKYRNKSNVIFNHDRKQQDLLPPTVSETSDDLKEHNSTSSNRSNSDNDVSFDRYTTQTDRSENNLTNKVLGGTGKELIDTIQRLGIEFNRMQRAVHDSEKEIDVLRKELTEISEKSDNTKQQLQISTQLNTDLKMNALEVQRMTKSNNHLENKLNELREKKKLSNKDELYQQERLLRIRNSEYLKAEQQLVTLDLEIQEIKNDIKIQNSKIKAFHYLQKLEFDKDIQLKLMRNEILHIQGSIQVFLGIKKMGVYCTFEHISEKAIAISNMSEKSKKHVFEFDQVFPLSDNWSDDIFPDLRPFISSTMDGYNVAIIAGSFDRPALYTSSSIGKLGLYEKCLASIFEECKSRRLWKYRITVSAVEIVENVLLDVGHQPVTLVNMKDNGKSILLQGLKEHTIDGMDSFKSWMRELHKTRKDYNQRLQLTASANSPHFLMMARLRGKSIIHGSIVHGLLTLCDITFAQTPEEIRFIQHGSMPNDKGNAFQVLSEVVEAMSVNARRIPFRDSKIVHLLKPCLTGDAKCLFLLTGNDSREMRKSTEDTMILGSKIMKMKSRKPKFGDGKAVRIYFTA